MGYFAIMFLVPKVDYFRSSPLRTESSQPTLRCSSGVMVLLGSLTQVGVISSKYLWGTWQ